MYMYKNLIYKINKYESKINILNSAIVTQIGGTHSIIIYVHKKDQEPISEILKTINVETVLLPEDSGQFFDSELLSVFGEHDGELYCEMCKNFKSLEKIYKYLIISYYMPLQNVFSYDDRALTLEEEYLAEKLYFASKDKYRLDQITTGEFGLMGAHGYYLTIRPTDTLPPVDKYYAWMRKKAREWIKKLTEESEGKGDD